MHLIFDIFTKNDIVNPEPIIKKLETAVEICGARKIETFVHSFGEGMGFTAFIMLAESHLAIHTWPEKGYVAMDVFMCNSGDPYAIVPFVESLFGYDYNIKAHQRFA